MPTTHFTAPPTTYESQHLDRKSLRKVTGPTADFAELARDCVCFANSAGGTLLIGLEDSHEVPPVGQRIDPCLPDRVRKRVCELTVNMQVRPEIREHENGGEYIVLTIPRSVGVAVACRSASHLGTSCMPAGDETMGSHAFFTT